MREILLRLCYKTGAAVVGAALLFGMSALLPGPSAAQQEEPPANAEKSAGDEAKADVAEKKEAEKKDDKEKSFDDAVKDMERIEGLFTFYRKADENKVLIEILPGQLDHDFLYSAKIENATGEKGFYGTIMMDSFAFQWRRLGMRVQFVRKNTAFRAAGDTPSSRAVANSFSDSVLTSGKILSKPHPDRNSVLVDLHELFGSADLHGAEQELKEIYKTGYKFTKDDSGIVFLKTFPKNSEIGLQAVFKTPETKEPSATLPDRRALTLRFRYSLVELPENGYMPRLADDRVGFFNDTFMDFTSDRPETPYVHYISRWKLEKQDPSAAVSEPVEPIVFWLENTIPVEYRDWVRDGILRWNPAFERIGFRNAIVAKQQPDDADWDPADIRYNTVRWFVAYDAAFAIGPSHSNPYTGQKIDADIGLSEAIMRIAARRAYEYSVHPASLSSAIHGDPRGVFQGAGGNPYATCDLAAGAAELAGFAHDVLAARPGWDAAKEEEYVKQFMMWVVAHEVGHTIGLRHNFRASTIFPQSKLTDADAAEVGLAASVMDYVPPLLAPPGGQQGEYYPTTVGEYDRWAIEYGYKPIPGASKPEDELAILKPLGAKSADPMLPYATDEDAGLTPRAIDPRNTRFDFSSKPLEWYSGQLKIVREWWGDLAPKLETPGESYEVLRRAFGASWHQFFRGGHVAMKYIGGIYHNRDHVGDPDGRLPFVPVPAAEQRAALRFLTDEIWSSSAITISPELLSKLQLVRIPDFDGQIYRTPNINYPLHDAVFGAQGEVLNDLYDPIKLGRLLEMERLQPDPNDRFTMAEMFSGIRKALWSELESGANIDSFRRNLQREHLSQLSRLLTSPKKDTPGDAIALARADLNFLRGAISGALTAQLDPISRAHLEDSQARIQQVLDAKIGVSPAAATSSPAGG